MQIPLFDLKKLEEIAKGNQLFVNKMIQLFIDETPKSIEEIKESCKNGDYAKVKAIAHRVKPSIDMLCTDVLKDQIREVEKSAELLKASEYINNQIFKLDNLVGEVISSLKKTIK
jgi:HPt (histidine-containing phosphotransfer) domain-containing protein